MNKLTPWVIRVVIVLVYIGMSVGEILSFLDDNSAVANTLLPIVMIASIIGFIVHAIGFVVHFIMFVIRMTTGREPLKSLSAMVISVVVCVIVLVFGFFTMCFSFPAASV